MGTSAIGGSVARALAAPGIMAPFARYSHGMEVPPGARLVFCSGQLGIRADGFVPHDPGDQAKLCFDNVAAILAEAGMGLEHAVRINAYVTDRAFLAPYMRVRDTLFSEPFPASTLMIVSGFARPEFKVEVEVVAAA